MPHFGRVRSAFVPIGVVMTLLLAPAPAAMGQEKWLELSIPDSLSDETPSFSIFGEPALSTLDLIRMIGRAKNDRQIKAIILKAPPAGIGLAKIQEVRDALADFRSAGKRVYSYLESAGNADYYFASVSDRIALNPVGLLMLNGLASQAMFLRGAFDKLGITPNFEQCYEYKSAADIYVRKDMSEAHREVSNSILDDLFGQWIDGIAAARKIAPDKLRSFVDRMPAIPEDAKQMGLVDDLMYQDEFDAYLEKENGNKKLERVKSKDYRGKTGGLFGLSFDFGDKPKVAVVYGQGGITSGKSASDFLTGATMGSDTIAEALRDARNDKSVKAIVFRVDSPGGSALASDVIWRETQLAKKEKPVVISMSNVAGSGGYYVAMGASKIVAEPATITGSIGVLGGKMNMKGLYQWVGLNKETISRGQRAELFSDWKDWTPEERTVFRSFIEHTYKTFVHKVAIGRGRTDDEIHRVAKGRIWTGRQGKDIGLVDELGGLTRALEIAKDLAGIAREAELDIVELPKKKDVFETIRELVEAEAISDLVTDDLRQILGTLKLLDRLKDEKALALMPESYEFR